MQLPSLLFLFVLLFSSTQVLAQETSFPAFISKVEQFESGYYQHDTLMRLPFIQQVSEVQYHYEVLFEEDGQVTFLEETFLGFNQSGRQNICRCSREEAMPKIRGQLKAWQDSHNGSMSINFSGVDQEFRQQNCLAKTIYQKGETGPRVEKILAIKPSSIAVYPDRYLSVNTPVAARLLKAFDDHWIIDLQLQLPDSLYLDRFANEHAMQYIQSDNRALHYSPASSPDWMRRLIQSGDFAQNMKGVARNDNWHNANRFNVFEQDEQGGTMLFHYYPTNSIKVEDSISIAGAIYAEAHSLTTKVEKIPMPVQEGVAYILQQGLESLILRQNTTANTGTYELLAGATWKTVRLLNAEEEELARFEYGHLHPDFYFTVTDPGEVYLELTGYQKQNVVVPFQVKVGTELLQSSSDTPVTGALVLENFRLNNGAKSKSQRGVRAKYTLGLSPDQTLERVSILRVKDNTGKDLMARQWELIEYLNTELANAQERGESVSRLASYLPDFVYFEKGRFEPNRRNYKLEIGILDLPAPRSSQVEIGGEFLIREADGDTSTRLWKQYLQLNTTIEKPLPIAEKTIDETLARAQYFSVFTLAGNLTQQGVLASIPFEIPNTDHWQYFDVDAGNSQLHYLKDEAGNDLIAAHFQTFPQRDDYRKTTQMRYVSDQEFNKRSLIQEDYPYYLQERQPEFTVHTYAASPAGERIRGRVTIGYRMYDRAAPRHHTATLTITQQETLTILLDSISLQFNKTGFALRDKDGEEWDNFSFTPVVMPVYLAKISVKDREGHLIELVAKEGAYPYLRPFDIRIPRERSSNEYQLLFEYYDLRPQQQLVDFVIGLGEVEE